MSRSDRIFCFEALDVCDPLVRAAERLYEQTQHPDERIPWGWIARSIKGRVGWRPGAWNRHLLVATPSGRAADPDALAGFAYGAHLPGYGGYVCYIGVADVVREDLFCDGLAHLRIFPLFALSARDLRGKPFRSRTGDR